MNEEKHDYDALRDYVADTIKQASNLGLSTIEEGGQAFLLALEHLQAVPEYFDDVVSRAVVLINMAARVEEKEDLTPEERMSLKAKAYQTFGSYMDYVARGLIEANDGAAVVLAPNLIAFLIPLFVPFEDWPEYPAS